MMEEERVYQEAEPPGPISEALEQRSDSDSSVNNVRLGMIADAFDSEVVWASENVSFVATPADVVLGGNLVRINVLAIDQATNDILPGLDNPYEFGGAIPFMVHDGTWRRETRSELDATTGEFVDVTVDVPNMVENPVEAMKNNISRIVLQQARSSGWGS